VESAVVTEVLDRPVVSALRAEWLTPALGAEVHGVDLAAIGDADFARVAALLRERQVLFFRGQALSQHAQRDLAARFGPLHVHPIYPQAPGLPEIMALDTDLNDLRDNALWHSDVSFSPTPPMGAVLAARTIPAVGGDTLWASATAAYDALPQGLKDFLAPLTATHDIAKSFPAERFGADPEGAARLDRAKRANPPVSHPVIRTHPETGRRAIYVNEGFTTALDGIDPVLGASILATLFAHVTRPEFTVRWRWREGDVAIWDNRVTQHYAIDDYRPHRRVMNRATIIGEAPV
jgi:taurine dioxygenase